MLAGSGRYWMKKDERHRIRLKADKRTEEWDACGMQLPHQVDSAVRDGSGASSALLFRSYCLGGWKGRTDTSLRETKREVQPPGAVRGPDGPSTSALVILRLDSWRSTGNGREYLLLL